MMEHSYHYYYAPSSSVRPDPLDQDDDEDDDDANWNWEPIDWADGGKSHNSSSPLPLAVYIGGGGRGTITTSTTREDDGCWSATSSTAALLIAMMMMQKTRHFHFWPMMMDDYIHTYSYVVDEKKWTLSILWILLYNSSSYIRKGNARYVSIYLCYTMYIIFISAG